jgi:5-methylthioribose kinase
MTQTQLKLTTPSGYAALSPRTVCNYLGSVKSITQRLGGKTAEWTAREVGDGNLNLVFIIEGFKGAVVLKQALPYVRMVGESWPLPLDRAHYEHLALVEQGRWAADYVPAIYHHDEAMALTVMEYLSPHIILRKGLIQGIKYPKMAQHVGKFLAHTLFQTSDYALDPVAKRIMVAQFLTNTAMCKISEDLLFDEPYYAAPMNRHTSPQLDDIALRFRKDADLKLGVQKLKAKFLNNAESLLHGDLHTGSVMVTKDDTRAIDPEFAFFGPMGFDVGAFLANLFLAYFSQAGHEQKKGERDEYALWLLSQAQIVWNVFASEFSQLWDNRTKGELAHPKLYMDSAELKNLALKAQLEKTFEDAIGFAGCKMIRRIIGLAHVEDFESIENEDMRSVCERKALEFARRLILERHNLKSIDTVLKAIQ